MKTNPDISAEIIIHSDKQKVWKILCDTASYAEWNPFIVSMSGEIKEGARLTNTMKNGNSLITFKPRIQKLIEGEYLEWLGHLWIPGLFDGRHFFKIEAAAEGHVKLTQGEYFSGLLSGLILKQIGSSTAENFKAMNRAIKERAEAMK